MQPFDLSKLRKDIDKNIKGLSHGFNDPKTFLSTGCYALNYLISDDFNGGLPLEGKFTMIAGDSGSGKSYIASANIIKDAQEKDVFCVLIDTENALDESWLIALDVDTDPSKMIKVTAAKVDDVATLIGNVIDLYKAENDTKPYKDRPKVLIIVDSLGMLITETMEKQFMEQSGMPGDLGIKAKQVTALLRVTMAKIASQPIGLLATNHVYSNQDKYSPDKISGGNMVEFASSVIVQMNKYLLRVDENEKKLEAGVVSGISCSAIVRKSRYAKPFERVHIQIPYTTGMNPYSGLFDVFLGKNLLIKSGQRYEYTSRKTGEIFCEFRKNLKQKGIYDIIMSEQSLWDTEAPSNGFDNSESADYIDTIEELNNDK